MIVRIVRLLLLNILYLMKILYLRILLLFGVLTGNLACSKSGNAVVASADVIYKGKLLSLGCSVVGINIESSNGAGLGTAYTDASGNTYSNVVVVINRCYVFDQKFTTDEINFQISADNKAPGSSCIVTQCILAGLPTNSVYIYNAVKAQ